MSCVHTRNKRESTPTLYAHMASRFKNLWRAALLGFSFKCDSLIIELSSLKFANTTIAASEFRTYYSLVLALAPRVPLVLKVQEGSKAKFR